MELAQAAQAAQQAGGIALLGTALTLGLRHGIDWDHLAAITDITSTGTSADAAEGVALTGHDAGATVLAGTWRSVPPLALPPALAALDRIDRRALWLASLYALGHAAVVVILGLTAIAFGVILPAWVDPVMERFVGGTLVVLGVWVVYSLVRHWRGERELRLRSRWMLVFDAVRHAWRAPQARLHGHSHDGTFHLHPVVRADRYGPRTALGTGIIHGIGAETGTQVLLIAAVGGAASQGLGAAMLFAFVAGLLVSNSAIALLSSTTFLSASRIKGLYVTAGCLTAVFSLVVGSYALVGRFDQLPDVQELISLIFGAPAA